MAATYNITINQNADFRRSFQVKENNVILNITGYTFSGRLKSSFNDNSYVDFTTSITDAAAGTFTIMADTATTKTRLLNGNAFVRQGVTP